MLAKREFSENTIYACAVNDRLTDALNPSASGACRGFSRGSQDIIRRPKFSAPHMGTAPPGSRSGGLLDRERVGVGA